MSEYLHHPTLERIACFLLEHGDSTVRQISDGTGVSKTATRKWLRKLSPEFFRKTGIGNPRYWYLSRFGTLFTQDRIMKETRHGQKDKPQ